MKNILVSKLKQIKYFFNNFYYLRVFNSPFIRPKIKFYFGPINFGTPYFYPRKWVKQKNGSKRAFDKKIGFDFVSLGYKLKWNNNDFRFEYSPLISFVFFQYQICILFQVPHVDFYWECWLYYHKRTDRKLTQQERINLCRKEFPQTWIGLKDGKKEKIVYYDLILKEKFL